MRTITWYYAVRRVSKLTETKLEVRFDECDRAGRGMHRGSRWNKYRYGTSSPSRELLDKVDASFPGTLAVFDHPVWMLAGKVPLDDLSFRYLIERLPASAYQFFVLPEVPDTSIFWLAPNIDHRHVLRSLSELSELGKSDIDRLTEVASVLTLIEIARIRKDEMQHFECHVHLAKSTSKRYPAEAEEALTWRLEAAIFERWLGTEYGAPTYRQLVDDMRNITLGPVPPWTPAQAVLRLGRSIGRREVADLQSSRGFWVAKKVEAWPTMTDLNEGEP